MNTVKESSVALLDYGFNVMGVNEIIGLCKPENIASKKVLENMGLKFRFMVEGLPEEFDFYNGEPFYSLTKEEYLQKYIIHFCNIVNAILNSINIIINAIFLRFICSA